MAVRRRRVVGGRQNKVVVRFTDEEFEVVSAAAARAGVSAPNLIATAVLGAAAGGLAGLDRRAVVEEMAAVRRFLEVCAAGLTGGDAARVAGMVEEAVGRLAGVLDELELLVPGSASEGVAGPGASGGDDVLGGGLGAVAEGIGDDGGGGLEDELPER